MCKRNSICLESLCVVIKRRTIHGEFMENSGLYFDEKYVTVCKKKRQCSYCQILAGNGFMRRVLPEDFMFKNLFYIQNGYKNSSFFYFDRTLFYCQILAF